MATIDLTAEHLGDVVLLYLAQGKSVEIDGLGVFSPDRSPRGFRFEPCARPQVFLAYVEEDAPLADRLFDALVEEGFNPWMDRRKLLPGQNWRSAIENAIASCDFFLACFSRYSVRKKGGFQAEVRYALECARQVPLEDIFIVPVRFDACTIPVAIRRELQYIDLFPDWGKGLRRIAGIMRRQTANRRMIHSGKKL
jgi:hypothetical protein